MADNVIEIQQPETRLKEIENLTTDYAQDYNDLHQIKLDIDYDLQKIKNKYAARMNDLSASIAEKGAALQEAIMNNSDLFEKPKTRVYSGIKVGLRKAKDTIDIHDEQTTIRLIEEKLELKSETLVKTEKSIIVSALSTLSEEELKSIGCYWKEGDDQPVIKSMESLFDKFISSLYKAEAA